MSGTQIKLKIAYVFQNYPCLLALEEENGLDTLDTTDLILPFYILECDMSIPNPGKTLNVVFLAYKGLSGNLEWS